MFREHVLIIRRSKLHYTASGINAQNFCFTLRLFHASTCFEHYVLIIRRSTFYYTVSSIITPVGGRPVHTGRPPIRVMMPVVV